MQRKDFFATRTGTAVVGASVLVVAALAMHAKFKVDCDDVYIHLRIAQNWANGNGPVFNVGERVEASTSPLWLVVLTIAIRLGIPGWTAAYGLAVLAAAGCGAGIALLAEELSGLRAAYLAPVLVATQMPFALWNAMPMEHGLAACLMVWTVRQSGRVASTRGAAIAGILAALTAATRPEATLLVPVFVVLGVRAAPPSLRSRVAIVGAIFAIAPLLAMFASRYSFYGSIFPNTYVAKVQGLPLTRRLMTGAGYLGVFLIFEPLLVVLAVRGVRTNPKLRDMAVLLGLFFLGILTTGGDWFPYSRLIVPVIPLFCILAAAGAVGIERMERHFWAAASVLVAVQMLISVRPKAHQVSRIDLLHVFVDECALIGRSFRRLPPGAIAMESIGVIGYIDPQRPILDLVGLADAHIARSPHLPGVLPGHDHSDVGYVISRAPALVMPYSWRRTHTVTDDEELAYLAKDHDSWAAGEALVRDPDFKKLYVPYDFILDSGDHLRLWRRKDFVAEASDPARANLDGSR